MVGLDQKHQVDVSKEEYQFNPNTNQYELQMALNEKIENESNIRLINDIWLENTESSHETHKKLETLIGDLDRLAKNKHLKREYAIGLSNVNFFMGNKDPSP